MPLKVSAWEHQPVKNSPRMYKLNIIEPWEFGTDQAIDVDIVARNQGQCLILLSEPRMFGEMLTSYLIGELREDSSQINSLFSGLHGTFAMNLVFSDEISKHNFPNLSMKSFRANFLLGEIIEAV